MGKKYVFFDTTFLHYGSDLRGIPQVILQLVRMFSTDSRFENVRFIATKRVCSQYLMPLGVVPERVETVGIVPLLPENSLFHGLLCSLRYGKIVRKALFIIHGEFRTVVRTNVPQAVMYYDLFLLEHFKLSAASRTARFRFFKCFFYRYLAHKLRISLTAQYKISISEFSKQQIIAAFPCVDPETITPLAIGTRRSLSRSTRQARRPDPSCLHLLYVGSVLEERKNVLPMLENLHAIVRGRPFRLHLVGKIDPESGRRILDEKIRLLCIGDAVAIHGVIPDIELVPLFHQSDFFLFPSLQEGFGLPVIEAMAHGLVVCAFNNTSIPEVGSDAIVLAETNDFGAWGERIDQLSRDSDAYSLLSQKAVSRAEEFSEGRMFERYAEYFMRSLPPRHR